MAIQKANKEKNKQETSKDEKETKDLPGLRVLDPKREGKELKPHRADLEIEYEEPHIFVHEEALKDMEAVVRCCKYEIGWLGGVRKLNKANHFLIYNIYLFNQGVHEATTEISGEAISEWISKIDVFSEEGERQIKEIRFWGHSHVNMGVGPSGQDEKQLKDLGEDGTDYFIRGIANKRGHIKFDIADFHANIMYRDVPWSIYRAPDPINQRMQQWEEHIKNSIKYISFGNSSSSKGKNSQKGSNRGSLFDYRRQPKEITQRSDLIPDMESNLEEIPDIAEGPLWVKDDEEFQKLVNEHKLMLQDNYTGVDDFDAFDDDDGNSAQEEAKSFFAMN